jgi:sugar lactone lactonase YvrE
MPVARVLVLALAASVLAQTPEPAAAAKLVLGEGAHRYEWVRDWGRLDRDLGNTHGGLVVDKQGRVLANTDTEQAVLIYSPQGELLGSWGKEFRGGLHGMCLRVEDGVEYLYLAHTGRHEAVKTTLDGKVLWSLGWPEGSGIYQQEQDYKPTAIAVAPDGRIYVADGYGKSWVHLYDKDRNYQKSIGGPGKDQGRFQTPHGLWIDRRGKTPLLLVCDRENHRLQWFDLDGNFVRMLDQGLRRPCNVCPLPDGGLAVADLAGRVTLLDKDDKVVLHLGDNPDEKLRAQNRVDRAQWQDGVFLSPHSVCADNNGDLYVMDWNFRGRISKLRKLGG